MNFSSLLILLSIGIGLLSCGSLHRHPNSGYYGPQLPESNFAVDFYQSRINHAQQEAMEELGLTPTQALSENGHSVLEQRLQLKRMESSIPTKREKQQYYKYKGLLPSDMARISFLRIPTVEARERWVRQMGISDDSSGYSEEMAKLIEANEIILGMSQAAVTESWGDPDVIEFAGDPIYRNERWKYSKYVSSEEGYRREMRLIYFEAGRVVGWETL